MVGDHMGTLWCCIHFAVLQNCPLTLCFTSVDPVEKATLALGGSPSTPPHRLPLLEKISFWRMYSLVINTFATLILTTDIDSP